MKDSDIMTFGIFSDVESVVRVSTEFVIVLGWVVLVAVVAEDIGV